jgi:hypothetical protein
MYRIAFKLREEISVFLKEELGLTLSLSKTCITGARKGKAKFLGMLIFESPLRLYYLKRGRLQNPRVRIEMPIKEVFIRLLGKKIGMLTEAGNVRASRVTFILHLAD